MPENDGDILSLTSHKTRRPELVKFLSENFPKGAPVANQIPFDEEFELLLCASNNKRILFVEQDNQVVATVAWRPYHLKNGLKVACLGLVCTHPDYRRQGLAKQLVSHAEEKAKEEHASIMCLWSDKVDYYAKLGYIPCGSEISWDIADFKDKNVSSTLTDAARISKLQPDQGHMLSGLYAKESIGPQRTLQSFQVQMKQSDSVAFFASHPSESKQAYALAGKGRDLRNVLHEVIGSPDLFGVLIEEVSKDLASHQTEEYPTRLQFPYTHPNRPLLEERLGAGEQGAVCLAKVLDMKNWARAINSELFNQGFKDLELQLLPPHENLEPWGLYEKEECLFLSPDPAHSLQIFCHPWELSALEGLNKETLKALENWMPYPLYFWGLDSV